MWKQKSYPERAVLLLTKADRYLEVWTRLLAQYEKGEWYQALRAADEILKLKPLDGAMRRKYEEYSLKCMEWRLAFPKHRLNVCNTCS